MTILSKPELSEKTRSSMVETPETRARTKLLDALEVQIKAAEAEQRGEIYTVPKTNYVTDTTTGVRSKREVQVPVKPWWWKDMAGSTFIQLKYGTKKLEIAPGKFSIEAGSGEKLTTTLNIVMEAVRGGELDDALMNARGGRHGSKVLKPGE